MVESASSGGRAGGGGRSGGGGELAVAVRWRWWRAGGGGGELAAVVESWQWWMVGDTFLTGFCLAGCGFRATLSPQPLLKCLQKKSRDWDWDFGTS